MFKAKQFSRFLVFLGAILFTACQSAAPPFQCTDKIGCVTIAPDQPVKIGVSQALSGGTSSLGIDQVRSIELAVADRSGELLGHPVQLQIEDDQCSGEGGVTAGLKIVADPQIVAILGTSCSGAAVTEAKVMSEAGLVMISGCNTAPSLTAIDGQQGPNLQPGYFRTSHNDAVQGRAAATFAFQELDIRKAATINDGDAYTRGLTEVFSQVIIELGGEIVLDAVINKGDTDMKPVLEAVATSGAELVFLPLFEPEGNFITLQAKEAQGFEHIILMGADSIFVSTSRVAR
jgi:branched-chain amino acid transport system substrate-binding protein